MGVTRASNFASRPTRPVKAVAAVVWAAALALCSLVMWSWFETRTLRGEAAQLAAHVERLEGQTAALSAAAAEAPEAGAIANQAARIDVFNRLTGPRRAPLATVLTLLEAELPPRVRISQLTYSAETGRLNLSLQAADEADLPPALTALEAAPGLAQVILERQIRLQQGNRNLVQYEIEAAAE